MSTGDRTPGQRARRLLIVGYIAGFLTSVVWSTGAALYWW